MTSVYWFTVRLCFTVKCLCHKFCRQNSKVAGRSSVLATLRGKNIEVSCQHQTLCVKSSFPLHHLHSAVGGSVGNGRYAGFVALKVWIGGVFIQVLLYFRTHEPVSRYETFELLCQTNADECTHSLLKHKLMTSFRRVSTLKRHRHGVRLIHCNSKFHKVIHQIQNST